ncbi:MAG TPA: sortase [Patescibacteria group bacterium]|nr:sortase [Patescibacteria group bacterium]
MAKYYKKSSLNFKKTSRLISFLMITVGGFIVIYIFFPLISWQVYFANAFTSQELATPIPKTTVLNSSLITSFISQASNVFSQTDYTNAENWFPNIKFQKQHQDIQAYALNIQKLEIKDAVVSTIDTNLSAHLVNYGGTAIPPQKGTAVIFGHSTLPQWFNPKDYKTIFATLHELRVGDEIQVEVSKLTFIYKIYNISVVDTSDISMFEQRFDDSYLTLVTCTPPGTTWKRLVIKAKLDKV